MDRMQARNLFAMLLISTVLLATYANAYVVGTAYILAPAVIPQNNGEALTVINLTVTSGTGLVSVGGPAIVGNSTVASAGTAAKYATGYLGLNFTKYNFAYTIQANSSNVTGPSAGAAMTLLAISALEHKPLRNDFTITGTINGDGTIGAIGGVYNKVQAAYQNGLDLVLVPAVPASSGEDELYLLVQSEFGVPVVQVQNITQAALFAFNRSMSGATHETGYNFYTNNYSLVNLPQATLNCSNSCNESAFKGLADYTIGLTGNAINALGKDARFYNISLQLNKVLDQSAAINEHGYLYTAADLAFLNYLTVFYFSAHNTTKASAFSSLEDVQNLCSSLMQPQITSSDYEYVLGAELRQAWGNYTINSTISNYNATVSDTDDILQTLSTGAEARGWCGAANFTYNFFMNDTANPIEFPASLSSTAMQRIQRAEQYGGMYVATAQQAYKNRNYPLAILDADYAFAINNASQSGMQTQQLLGAAQGIAQNSTYGVWATEFAKESQFYAYQSASASNATLAHGYAVQAYSSALLAEQMSQDMKLLFDASVQTASSSNQTTAVIMQDYELERAIYKLTAVEDIVAVLLVLVAVILAANLLLIIILKMHLIDAKPTKKGARRRRRK
jgi:hypothetical protein